MCSKKFSQKQFYSVLWIFSLILYLAVFWRAQSKLIYTDEVWFAKNFAHISKGLWQQIVISHPPLHASLGGLAASLFGDGFLALRLIGDISFLLTLALISFACRKLFHNEQKMSLNLLYE